MNEKKPSQPAWGMVTRPKCEDGIGIVKMEIHNDAFSRRIFINFLIKLISHGYICFGTLIFEWAASWIKE